MNSVNQSGGNTDSRILGSRSSNWRAAKVFEIMLGCKLEPLNGEEPPPPEFTAIVGLAGQLCGVLSLRCNARSATLMASKMLGVDPQQADEHMWDALGEVANMIAGNFKNKLTGMGDGLHAFGAHRDYRRGLQLSLFGGCWTAGSNVPL